MAESGNLDLSQHEIEFSKFLLKSWNNFEHGYTKRGKKWECTSLKDAEYEWGGMDKAANRKVLEELSSKLDTCLERSPEFSSHALHHVCLEILEWGGVEGVSSKWLRESCDQGLLHNKINKAIELLKAGPEHGEWHRFDNHDIVMNSALTKVYALADPKNIPIYDGRVGAGLGLLVTFYLEGLSCPPDEVPAELQFRWGAGQTAPKKGIQHPRNPSTGCYKFNKLRTDTDDHAVWCWRTGRVLRHAVELINNNEIKKPNPVELRDIEEALFMIGNAVHPRKLPER